MVYIKFKKLIFLLSAFVCFLLFSNIVIATFPGPFRHKLEGFDFNSLDDPNKQNNKYRAARVFEHFAPDSKNLNAVVSELRRQGNNVVKVGFDEIDFNDGFGAVDVIRASDVEGGGEAWQWLVQGTPHHAPTLRVIGPNGGEVWEHETTQSITWTSKTFSSNTIPSRNLITVQLIKSTGEVRTFFATQNDDIEPFFVSTDITPGLYKARIFTNYEGRTIEDTSDDFFKIKGRFLPNNPPIISSCNPVASSITVGSTATINYAISDPEGDSFTVTINWGDGSTSIGTATSASHPYTRTGTFSVTITATDSKGASTVKSCGTIAIITVPNNPPVISSCSPVSSVITLGSTATINYVVFDQDGDAVTVKLDWGDGTFSFGGLSSATHNYASTGTFSVTITAKDSKGATTSKSCGTIIVISAPNNPPSISSCTPSSSSIILSSAATISYSVSDPDGDAVTITVNWGDGITSTGGSSSASHIYASTGTFSVTITATDSKGASTVKSCGTITVTSTTNNPPVISSCSLVSSSITVGSTATINYAISDPDGDSFSVTVDWGDGQTSIGGTSSASHVYNNPGMFTVTVRATDSRGLTSSRNCGSITVTSVVIPPSQPPTPRGAKLIITDVDAKVDGKTDSNLKDNDKISEEAKPESDVEFQVTVKNNFTSAEGLEIEDIKVKITIEGIDDGDDLDEESREFDLRPQNDKKVTLRFKLPLNVEEGSFDVSIEAEGEDENGNEHKDELDLELEVEKEKHDLRLLRFGLNKQTVNCNESFVASYEIINLGQEDETKASVEIKSEELGIDAVQKGLAINSGAQDNTISKSQTLKISNSVEDGTYTISASVFSDDGKLKDTKTTSLNVKNCPEERKIITKEKETKKEKEVVKRVPITTSIVQVVGTETVQRTLEFPVIEFLFKGTSRNLILLVASSFILSIFLLIVAIVLFIRLED